MKKSLLFLAFFVVVLGDTQAQHAINGLGFIANSTDYATVADDASLDIEDAISVELWIKPTGDVNPDQKLLGKSATTFPLVSSYVIGFINGEVLWEVYDDNSETLNTKGGSIISGAWNHIAGTFDANAKTMKLYVNGELVDEDTNADIGPFTYVTTPMILGAAPWFTESKNFDGHMDEARVWRAVLDQQTIRDWMHRDLDDSHPDWDNLSLYHKYNEGIGQTASDSGPLQYNSADVSTLSQWTISEAPFKGTYNLEDSTPQGIWEGHTMTTSSILTISNPGISGISSVLVGHSNDDLGDTYNDGPGEFVIALGRVWKATTQGTPDMATVTADLSMLTVEDVINVALAGAPSVSDLPSATVYEGSVNGNTFTADNVDFQEGWYYTLVFDIAPVSTEVLQVAADIHLAPNPTNGVFEVQLELETAGDVDLRLYNLHGQELTRQELTNVQSTTVPFDLTSFPKGTYTLKIRQGDALTVKRVVLQ